MPADDERMTLRLPPEIHEKMTAAAHRSRRSLNAEIIVACEEHIAKEEATRGPLNVDAELTD